jgi:peptidoglycan/xylan/chitin deacetylase (PgdA/CDA1 family)
VGHLAEVAGPTAAPPTTGRRRAAPHTPPHRRAPGRRRAVEDNPWTVAAEAAQRAAVDLTRRVRPVAQPTAGTRTMSIVVRPEPAGPSVREPVGRQILGTLRDWTSADEHGPPVTGIHRAPGTLPIETWLLIGRGRQQALLAALVAVGLLLIMIPVQQRQSAVDTAAGSRAISTDRKGRASRAPATTAPAGSGKARTRPTTAAPAPAPTGRADDEPKPGGGPSGAPPAEVEPSGSAAPSTSPEASPGSKVGPATSRRLTGSDAVALTFDDGPDPVQTPKLLALLAQHHVTATFCLVGRQVKAHPDIVRQIVAGGHALCNHSWDHSFKLGKESPRDIRADLEATSAAIREAVPDADIPYFRAPGGFFTDRLVSVAGDYGMISIYWEVDPRDWERQDGESDEQHVDRVVRTVRTELRPGGIVLSHDFNQPGTITAYERLLPYIAGSFRTGLP